MYLFGLALKVVIGLLFLVVRIKIYKQSQKMMANKLEEMKRKLLLQTKKVEAVGSPVRVENFTPLVQASPSPDHVSNPIRLAIQPSISQSADEESAQNQPQEEQHQQMAQVVQLAVIEPIVVKESSQPALAENIEIVIQQSEKEKPQAGEIQQEGEEQIVSQPLIPQPSEKGREEQQSLELIREPNISVSIDEETRINLVMQGKLNEMHKEMLAQKPAESKAEKKTKKIVLKELIKVKECIKNLQSALKGLEYVQQKLKLYPILKERLHFYVLELKNLNNE